MCSVCWYIYGTNKSDRLYQRFTFAGHALAYSAIFTGPTDCGKSVFSNLFSKLVKREYKKHFDHIIIICPTLRWDKIILKVGSGLMAMFAY